MLEHLRVPRQESTTRVDANAAFDLHHGHRIIRETAEKSGEGAGGQMAAALTIAMELRFPAVLDVYHRQRIVQRAERHAAPAGGLKKLAGSNRELVDGKVLRLARAALREPRLERVEQRRRAGVARFAKRIRPAAAGTGDAQPQVAQRSLCEADQLWRF